MCKLLLPFVSLMICSCQVIIPEKDLIGIWHANDGAVIEINEDYTCTVSNINGCAVFNLSDSVKMSFTGTWRYFKGNEFTNDYGVTIIPNLDPNHYVGFVLYFTGEGLLENSKPYSLYFYIDIDSLARYQFYK